MKTISGRARSRSRFESYVVLILTLAASVALQGTGLWTALHAGSRFAAAPIAAISAGTLACLIAGALLAAAMRREGGAARQRQGAAAAGARARNGEEADAVAHARKMEALGLLAGGVAHDFNNQLQVIRNSLMVLERQPPPTDGRRYLEMIRRSADRAGSLSRQLLAFSRRQPVAARPLDPNALVTQTAELLRHSLGEHIVIETVLGREVAEIGADADQLETALLNLAINARDAMSHAGRLTLETANATLDGSSRLYVLIAVSDTGTGMPPETAARACEPFFTTKGPGQGTGLGLAQVARFAYECGGHLRIASAPGEGTTVRLYLPEFGRLPDHPGNETLPARWNAWSIKNTTGTTTQRCVARTLR